MLSHGHRAGGGRRGRRRAAPSGARCASRRSSFLGACCAVGHLVGPGRGRGRGLHVLARASPRRSVPACGCPRSRVVPNRARVEAPEDVAALLSSASARSRARRPARAGSSRPAPSGAGTPSNSGRAKALGPAHFDLPWAHGQAHQEEPHGAARQGAQAAVGEELDQAHEGHAQAARAQGARARGPCPGAPGGGPGGRGRRGGRGDARARRGRARRRSRTWGRASRQVADPEGALDDELFEGQQEPEERKPEEPDLLERDPTRGRRSWRSWAGRTWGSRRC